MPSTPSYDAGTSGGGFAGGDVVAAAVASQRAAGET